MSHNNYTVNKISDVEYRIDSNTKQGMNVPCTIYADESLLK